MKLSVVINTYNEGNRVRSTCQQFLENGADEVVICADGTTDGSCNGLPNKVVVLRNDIPQGCGKAKFKATLAAKGDVIMWVDAHQSVYSGDLRKVAETALKEDAVFSPGLCNIFYNEEWQPQRFPGSLEAFYPNRLSISPFNKAQYQFKLGMACPAVGVGVFMNRRTYLKLGGWNRYRGRFGSQERGMALKAFMACVPVFMAPELVLGHEFWGKTHPSRNPERLSARPSNVVPSALNAVHAYMAVCGTRLFDEKISPWLQRLHSEAGKKLDFAEALADRDYFLRFCKRRPDDELLELIESLSQDSIPADRGGARLEQAALDWIGRIAHGRVLEFGTGSGAGTKILLESAIHVTSIDHQIKYSQAVAGLGSDRAEFVTLPIDAKTGFYEVSALRGLFDTILIDGPPGTRARRYGIQSVAHLLAPGGVILVDDAKRDIDNITAGTQAVGMKYEILPTHRGLAKITTK